MNHRWLKQHTNDGFHFHPNGVKVSVVVIHSVSKLIKMKMLNSFRLAPNYCCADHVNKPMYQYQIRITVDIDRLDFLVHRLLDFFIPHFRFETQILTELENHKNTLTRYERTRGYISHRTGPN